MQSVEQGGLKDFKLLGQTPVLRGCRAARWDLDIVLGPTQEVRDWGRILVLCSWWQILFLMQ